VTPSEFVSHLEGVRETGDGQWQACCPAHDDRQASLSVRAGDDGKTALFCHAGCQAKNIVSSVGLQLSDLFPEDSHKGDGKGRIVATYDYPDENGELLYQAYRKDPKDFRQRRPDGNGGWDYKLGNVRRVPYRLPELLKAAPAEPVFIAEGEKDVNRLAALGLVATCNVGGAGKWRGEYNQHFAGRDVVILPDNDDPGEQHACKVAAMLLPIARSVKILYLPDLPVKGDVSDWLDAGGTVEKLNHLVAVTVTQSSESLDLANSVTVTTREVLKSLPFPIHTLPGPVGDYVRAAAKAIGCDLSFIALPMLACLARAVGNARVIRLKRSWTEPAIVWCAIVGQSGSHKTPALQVAMKFLDKRQAKAMQEHVRVLEEHQTALAEYERDIAAWRKSKKSAEDLPPQKPQEPHPVRYVTSDCTIEALASLLAVQFDGILVSRDELAGWIGGIAEYKGGKGSDLGHWLACWSAVPLVVDRKTGAIKFVFVPRASVSLIGGIQPGVLRSAIAREHMQDGLCARILFAMPDPKPVRWTDATVDPDTEQAIEQVFDRLFSLESAADAEGNPEPFPLDLSPEAKSVWIDYYNRHRTEAEGLDDDLRAAWSKLEAYAARFALIIQLCTWASGDAFAGNKIDESSMLAAIELSDWFGNEAKKIYGLFVETDSEREQRELLDWVRRRGGKVAPRDLAHGCRQYRGSGEAESALGRLVESGLGSWQVENNGGPGRPATYFVCRTVAPVTVTQFNETAEIANSVTVTSGDGPETHTNGHDPDAINRMLAESMEDFE